MSAGGVSTLMEVQALQAFIIQDLPKYTHGPAAEFWCKFDVLVKDLPSNTPFEDHAELITSMLRILELSTDTSNVLARFAALSIYFKSHSHREMPMGLETLEAAIKIMDANSNNGDIQMVCSAMIKTLLKYATEPQHTRVVGLILGAMRTNEGVEEVQDMGISALGDILFGHQPSLNAAVELGGIRLVVKAMRMHRKNWHVQCRACYCLSLFARQEHIEPLWREQALPCVLKAMKFFLSHANSSAGVHDDMDNSRMDVNQGCTRVRSTWPMYALHGNVISPRSMGTLSYALHGNVISTRARVLYTYFASLM